ncbi:CpaD family pilus assembly protein [Oricola thermophila]|uniref:CpaD family pilus assembly protein n=1 Tax=Oricola thermophila TaxID=2742145 RepID=A0A6N1VJR6_9HYPH|nr:CpaD family pilus assembly lipoprotein [Oricola thermophila]QKV19469.1 CpaD family pilus assembly protein [Oricola thermophila]
MRSRAIVKSAGLLLVAVAFAGCARTDREHIEVGGIPLDYRARHPIVLDEQEKTIDIPIASGARELNSAVRSNIRGFASGFAEAGTGSLFVILPSGSPNAHAVGAVKEQIIESLVAGGAPRNRLILQHYDASAHGSAAAVRLSYNTVSASAGPCGNWPDDLADTKYNRNYYDYGCSSQANLAAIIANPVDLMGPRQSSSIDATQRAAVIEDYQSGPRGAASEVRY